MFFWRLYYIALHLSIFLFSINIHGAKLLTGDSGSGKSFNFSIGPNVFFKNGADQFILYVGANEEKLDNNFSVARIERNSSKFQGLTPKKIKLNYNEIANNPLNGAKIAFLQAFQSFPIIVKDQDVKVYLINEFTDNKLSMFVSPEINDANGEKAAKIVQLGVANASTLLDSLIFAAVKNKNGDPFGANGSGIAILKVNNREIKKREQGKEVTTKIQELVLVDANNEIVVPPPTKSIPTSQTKSNQNKNTTAAAVIAANQTKSKAAEVIKAVPFNGSIASIKINHDAAITSDVIDFYWDEVLGRLYVAIQVKSGNSAASGARAVVVGRYVNGQLSFAPIAPDNVFVGNDKIVGTGDSASDVSIYKVRVMHTSTLLDYLIVAGGNGVLNAVSNTIYALPLVNKKNARSESTQGTLAKFDQAPQDNFIKSYFSSRSFPEPAATANDVLKSTDIPAMVGGGELPLSAGQIIKDVFIIGDAVFASIGNDYNGTTQPGIFYSQSIFDDKGLIQSWTKWQRIAGTDDKIFGANIDFISSQFWYLTGSSESSINSVKVTNWENGEKNSSNNEIEGTYFNLIKVLNNIYPRAIGGIQAFFDFPKTTNGFANFSMMIATGLKKISLVESGKIQNGFFRPVSGNFATGSVQSQNGKFPNIEGSTKVVTIENGILNDIDSIITAQIITDVVSDKHWVAVGGVGGLAILMDSNGNGWNGSITSLQDIPAGLEFKKVGNYSFVNKIKSDGNFLYVLTDKKLDRIDISSDDFKTGNLKVKTLANLDSLKLSKQSSLTDFALSDKFALLATTQDLFRVGNGKDIRIAVNATDVNWTIVPVPQSVGTISKLLFITPTGDELDFAFKGQVYVINSYRGLHQTRINRFFVNLDSDINDSTILPLPDIIIKNLLDNVFDYGNFRDNYSNNFSINFSSVSKDVETKPFLSLTTGIRSGSKFISTFSFKLPISLLKDDTQIGPILVNSAAGSVLVTGSFGLQVSE